MSAHHPLQTVYQAQREHQAGRVDAALSLIGTLIADSDQATARCLLDRHHPWGEAGLPELMSQAIFWLRLAACFDDCWAQYQLSSEVEPMPGPQSNRAYLQWRSDPVDSSPLDWQEAVYWLRQSALAGYDQAINDMIALFEEAEPDPWGDHNDKPTPVELEPPACPQQTLYWLERYSWGYAPEPHNGIGRHRARAYLQEPHGQAQQLGLAWYQQAIADQDGLACLDMALWCRHGLYDADRSPLIPRDPARAQALLTLAAAQGVYQARAMEQTEAAQAKALKRKFGGPAKEKQISSQRISLWR
ncbi:hypothetical protein [Ferrimonas pelagia]|uniref:Sel1 repeat family protein n=1 Tax=Ferrimonas pelagia TaxID=1177826 RepID=A0ABP9EPE8_9GAMM